MQCFKGFLKWGWMTYDVWTHVWQYAAQVLWDLSFKRTKQQISRASIWCSGYGKRWIIVWEISFQNHLTNMVLN